MRFLPVQQGETNRTILSSKTRAGGAPLEMPRRLAQARDRAEVREALSGKSGLVFELQAGHCPPSWSEYGKQ
jgi:hypothetical protein